MAVSLGDVTFSGVGEDQIEWTDQYTWQPIGQYIRYALAGNPVIIENPRSGRPITLVAEMPWCWLSASLVSQLDALAQEINYTFTLTYGTYTSQVRFRRDQGPLDLTPINSAKTHYTGSIFLICV